MKQPWQDAASHSTALIFLPFQAAKPNYTHYVDNMWIVDDFVETVGKY